MVKLGTRRDGRHGNVSSEANLKLDNEGGGQTECQAAISTPSILTWRVCRGCEGQLPGGASRGGTEWSSLGLGHTESATSGIGTTRKANGCQDALEAENRT